MSFAARTLNDLNLAAQQANANSTGLICLRYVATATGAESVSLGKVNGIAGRIVDAHIIAREATSTPTVTIKGGSAGTTTITNAMSKSGTITTLTRCTTIADVALANGDTLNAVFSAAGVVEVVLFIAPTQIPA